MIRYAVSTGTLEPSSKSLRNPQIPQRRTERIGLKVVLRWPEDKDRRTHLQPHSLLKHDSKIVFLHSEICQSPPLSQILNQCQYSAIQYQSYRNGIRRSVVEFRLCPAYCCFWYKSTLQIVILAHIYQNVKKNSQNTTSFRCSVKVNIYLATLQEFNVNLLATDFFFFSNFSTPCI